MVHLTFERRALGINGVMLPYFEILVTVAVAAVLCVNAVALLAVANG